MRKPDVSRILLRMRDKDGRKGVYAEWDAYLTVFLSLCLPVILSLLLVLLEGARMSAIRMQIEVTADTAADSVLAEYHKELMEQYDLLMIDTSYGTDSPAVSNTEAHLESYMEKNFSAEGSLWSSTQDFTGLSVDAVSILETRFAADNDAEALREQIYAYYAAEPLEAVLAEILADIDTFDGLSLDTTLWSTLKEENEAELKEQVQEAQEEAAQEEAAESDPDSLTQSGETSEEEDDTAQSQAQELVESQGISAADFSDIYSTLDQLMSLPILTQLFGDTSSLSQSEIDGSQVLSGRTVHTGDAYRAENSHDYEEADAILFDVYAAEKCGSYVNQLDKSVLKYQLEYILYGKETDLENLEKTAETILAIRLAANLVTILQDTEKMELAEALGTALAFLCFMQEELQPLFKTAVVLIWTYMESLADVRALLGGEEVPLIKSSSQWKTSLASAFAGAAEVSSGESGLNYETYLQILLYLESGSTKNYRLMDLMEMDIRATEGNENFQMDWCMDAFEMEAVVSSSYGYSYTVFKEATYN